MAEPLKLRPCIDRLVFVAPTRFVLAAICVALAWAAGAKQPGAAFAFSCVGLAAPALTDRRSVLLGRAARAPVSDGACLAGRWEAALSAGVPSTIAVTAMSLLASTSSRRRRRRPPGPSPASVWLGW